MGGRKLYGTREVVIAVIVVAVVFALTIAVGYVSKHYAKPVGGSWRNTVEVSWGDYSGTDTDRQLWKGMWRSAPAAGTSSPDNQEYDTANVFNVKVPAPL